jgi:hypothetical protein
MYSHSTVPCNQDPTCSTSTASPDTRPPCTSPAAPSAARAGASRPHHVRRLSQPPAAPARRLGDDRVRVRVGPRGFGVIKECQRSVRQSLVVSVQGVAACPATHSAPPVPPGGAELCATGLSPHLNGIAPSSAAVWPARASLRPIPAGPFSHEAAFNSQLEVGDKSSNFCGVWSARATLGGGSCGPAHWPCFLMLLASGPHVVPMPRPSLSKDAPRPRRLSPPSIWPAPSIPPSGGAGFTHELKRRGTLRSSDCAGWTQPRTGLAPAPSRGRACWPRLCPSGR